MRTIILALLISPAAPAYALSTSPSPTMDLLGKQADAGAVLTGSPEAVVDRAGKKYDGQGAGFGSVQVPGPVETAEVDGSPADRPSYHFEGRKTAIPNLTIYTPVKDPPGEDGRTETPAGSTTMEKVQTGLLLGGAAATIGGIFFTPLLFLGGFLLGAWATIKFLSR